MNLYFFFIGSLQLWRDVAPVNPLKTWIPIIVIFAIAFLREGIDDFNLHIQDRELNDRLYRLIRDGREMELRSCDLQAGGIVRLTRN
jgi:phospholipid-translocating ATPase